MDIECDHPRMAELPSCTIHFSRAELPFFEHWKTPAAAGSKAINCLLFYRPSGFPGLHRKAAVDIQRESYDRPY